MELGKSIFSGSASRHSCAKSVLKTGRLAKHCQRDRIHHPPSFFLWSAFALGYAFVAIPSGRMAHRLAERLSFSRRNLGAVMALGIVVALVSLVPLLNVLFMPVFVIAGTLLYIDATHGDAGSSGNTNGSGQA